MAGFESLSALALANPLLERIVVASVELTLLAALVSIVSGAKLVRNPRVLSLLWALVLLKPIVSLAVGGSAPLGLPVELTAPVRPVVFVAMADTHVADTPAAAKVSLPLLPLGNATNPIGPDRAEGTSVVPQIVLWVWLLGVAALMGHALLDRLRLASLIADSQSAALEQRIEYASLAREMGIRRAPALRITDRLSSPALAGSFFCVVLMPAWMTSERQRAWALRHELTHWKHGDPLIGLVRQICTTLFFFHPVAWWAGRKWEEAAELACDRAMVSDAFSARAYADELFAMCRQMRYVRSEYVNGLYATRTQLGKRIAALLQSPPSLSTRLSRRGKLTMAACAVLVLACGLEFRSAQAARADATVQVFDGRADIEETDGTTMVALKARGRIEFTDSHREIVSMGNRATIELRESVGDRETRLIVRADDDGGPVYEYTVNGRAAEFDEPAREWFARSFRALARGSRPAFGRLGRLFNRQQEIELTDSVRVSTAGVGDDATGFANAAKREALRHALSAHFENAMWDYVDEPAGGLDDGAKRRIMTVVNELSRRLAESMEIAETASGAVTAGAPFASLQMIVVEYVYDDAAEVLDALPDSLRRNVERVLISNVTGLQQFEFALASAS